MLMILIDIISLPILGTTNQIRVMLILKVLINIINLSIVRTSNQI
jgi:hypothetical protein